VIEDVSKKYSRACTVKTAGKPSQPIEKSTAGASLLTQVIVAKFADHLPDHSRRLMVYLSGDKYTIAASLQGQPAGKDLPALRRGTE
jgi:hypothetical protein